jgi:hypothetical protein
MMQTTMAGDPPHASAMPPDADVSGQMAFFSARLAEHEHRMQLLSQLAGYLSVAPERLS